MNTTSLALRKAPKVGGRTFGEMRTGLAGAARAGLGFNLFNTRRASDKPGLRKPEFSTKKT